MNKQLLVILITILGSRMAQAYEYHLQFAPPAGAHGISVAGYSFYAEKVSGNCSYSTSKVTGGRYGHTVVTPHYAKCTWDLYGNLISMLPETLPLRTPPVLSTSGFETIYASEGTSKTGTDGRGFGFVSTPSAHYSWETPNGAYSVIGDSTHVFAVNLVSDGDFPLVVDKATVQEAISGTTIATAGTAKIMSSSCGSSLPVKSACSIIVSYSPTTIACTTSPYGFAYTTLDLSLITDAGANPAFRHGFTITGVPVCGD